MNRSKTKAWMFGLSLAMLAGVATGAAASNAQSCLSICRNVYVQCIANGGGAAECEEVRDQCRANCAPAARR